VPYLWGNLRTGCGRFQGRTVGGVRCLSGKDALAKQSGRQSAASIDFPPLASELASVVTRWQADCVSASIPGEPDRIHVVAANGGSPEPITAETQYTTDPNWSPEGDARVFGSMPWLEAGAPGAASASSI